MKKFICSTCNKLLKEKEKYCPYCGKQTINKLNQDELLLNRNIGLVYGPPFEEKFKCNQCHKVVIESGLGSPSKRIYCIYCGAKYKEKENDL